MTIIVCCNLPDGIIIGADSAVTVSGEVEDQSGKRHAGVLKVYERARKIFQLGELPVGVAAFGVSAMGQRTVASYLEEFELDKLQEVAPEGKVGENLEPLCKTMWEFLERKYRQEFKENLERRKGRPYDDIPADERPPLAVVVAGYGYRRPLGEVWLVKVPFPGDAEPVVPVRRPGDFGANWFGVSGPVTRFILGFDPSLPARLRKILQERVTDKYAEVWPEIERELRSLEFAIPYPAMPLEDGIEHVRYLTGLAISFARFAVGAPICGGEIRLATITARQGFSWVTQ